MHNIWWSHKRWHLRVLPTFNIKLCSFAYRGWVCNKRQNDTVSRNYSANVFSALSRLGLGSSHNETSAGPLACNKPQVVGTGVGHRVFFFSQWSNPRSHLHTRPPINKTLDRPCATLYAPRNTNSDSKKKKSAGPSRIRNVRSNHFMSSTGQSTSSPPNFQLIINALADC